jgi:polysaccharide export outer membrane protein
MYSAGNLPREFIAPQHISARHVDFSRMQRNVMPAEWLQPGDKVNVSIATGVETGNVPKWDLVVDSQGTVDVPLVGATPVAGLSPNAAAERIRLDSIRRGLFIDPKVTVAVTQPRTYRVSVVGAVNKPDTYDIPVSDCDILTALTMAEGVSDSASRFVQIRHSPQTLRNLAQTQTVGPDGVALASFQNASPPPVVNLDLSKLQSTPSNDLQLYEGSVISVEREPKRFVSVIGLVRLPKQVDMPDGEDLMLLDAIAVAGGTTLSIADKVQIVRTIPGNPTPIVIEASLKEARSGGNSNLRLAAGDVVSVEETPSTIVLQTIQTFFRVGFSAALPGT